MESIGAAIELQDNFTGVLYYVIDSVNAGISAMEELYRVMDSPIEAGAFLGIRDCIDQAAMAARKLAAETDRVDIPETTLGAGWQMPGVEVFTGSGIDRFRQEVQSADAMLERLHSTQDAIARQAYDTAVFPPEAAQSLNRMTVRIDMVRERIRQMENNPLNMGTDAANAELETLRGQLESAVREQQNLVRAVEDMDVAAANESYLRLNQVVGKTEQHIRDNVDEQGRLNREIGEGTNKTNGLIGAIKSAAASCMDDMRNILSNAFSLSDQLMSTAARLGMMNDGLQTTQELQDMIFASAERARCSYQTTADAVADMGIMAGDAFGSSEEIVAFVEQVNKQFGTAGMETQEMDAAMQQLTQAMGAGVLQGEAYNSILQQAPNLIRTIADYLEVPREELSNMAAEGAITADIVKAAMFAAADETNREFESMPMTFAQIWTSFENSALSAFAPVLQRMNEMGNSENFQGFAAGIAGALSVAAGIALDVLDLLNAGVQLVADNWSWLSPIIYGVAGALALYYGWQMALNTINLVSKGIHVAMAAVQMIHAAVTGTLTAATAANIAAQNGLNTAMQACPIVWIIILIIALIAAFYGVVEVVNHLTGSSLSAMGIICGAVAAAGAFILNLAIGLINSIYQAAWQFVTPFLGIVEWILNAADGGFDSFGGAVANLIGNIISWFLSLGMVVTKIIDAIFGTDWTAGLSSLRDTVLAWGKNENAITIDRAAPEINYRIKYGEAWDAGYSFGEGIDESIANFDPASLFGTDISDLDSYTDPDGYATGLEEIGGGVEDIAGNTGAMADAMEITGEELKYLRDIAEQEAVNRFTAAEIKIEQTNHNTIKNDLDLDGIVSGMTDMMNEAIDISTEGVHN